MNLISEPEQSESPTIIKQPVVAIQSVYFAIAPPFSGNLLLHLRGLKRSLTNGIKTSDIRVHTQLRRSQ